MNYFIERLTSLLISFWVGGLWTMLMVTTIVFNKIPSTYIAGEIVADMFSFMNLFGISVSFILLTIGFKFEGFSYFKKISFWLILFLLIIISISYFGINPFLETLKIRALPKEVMESVFADRFNAWHGIASIAYLIECALGAILIIKMKSK